MDTTQLNYFIALGKELNFTTVANQFYTTQPTVCRKMTALEEEIGVKLINRSTHSVTLTRAGKEYLRYAVEMINMLESSARFVRSISEERVKVLKFAIFSSSEDILMACIREFNELYPDIQIIVDIFSGNAMSEALSNQEYSFYFLHTKLIESRADFRHVHTKREKSCLVVRDRDADKVNEQDFSGLKDSPFVCPTPTGGFVLYELFMNTCAALNITPNIVNMYGRASSTFLGAQMGIGNTILPASLVRQVEGVKIFPIEAETAYLDSCIAWRNSVHMPEVDAFKDYVLEKFS